MSIIAFIVIGFVIGLIARAIVPGSQSMGLLATTGLGIAGSFIGGLVASVMYPRNDWTQLYPHNLLFSVLGAVLLLVAIIGVNRRARVKGDGFESHSPL